jgi:hypothetical protein
MREGIIAGATGMLAVARCGRNPGARFSVEPRRPFFNPRLHRCRRAGEIVALPGFRNGSSVHIYMQAFEIVMATCLPT